MSRFTNVATAAPKRPAKNGSTIVASKKADSLSGNGAPAYSYKDKAALFLLGVSNFTGQNTVYEDANDRDSRFVDLIRSVAKKDPQFVASFLKWLRSDANIRTAAIIGAIEYGRQVSGTDLSKNFVRNYQDLTPRAVLASVFQRADEPSEALGYWLSTYGKKTPRWFQRALGDGAQKLYTERAVFKYDSQGDKVRFGDVINLSSVKTIGYKADVFKFALDRRYSNVNVENFPELGLVQARAKVDAIPAKDRASFLKDFPQVLEQAGYSWESLAGWLNGPLTKDFWEALIPNMGYMALIRNLRNFAKAGISLESAQIVADRISDQEQVESSRQLPLRFLSSYRAIQPDQPSVGYWGARASSVENVFTSAAGRQLEVLWAPALDKALNYSLKSVPVLKGQTVIMVDCSGSMGNLISDKSTVTYYENAVAFGVALALKNPGSVIYGYDNKHKVIKLVRGGSLLDNIASFKQQFPLYGGTNTVQTAAAVMQAHPDAARLVILTDEQTSHGGYNGYSGRVNTLETVVPEKVTCVTFNLAGYQNGQAPAGRGNFHTVPGLNDSGFKMLEFVDSVGEGATWPWDQKN